MIVTRRQFVRSLPKSAFCHAHTVLPCSHAAKHRLWLLQHWVQARTSRSLTLWKVNTANASCCTTTSLHTLLVKLAAWALRVAAKLVTVNWHGVPLTRCCQVQKTSRTQSVQCQRLLNQTVHLQWQLFVVHHCP